MDSGQNGIWEQPTDPIVPGQADREQGWGHPNLSSSAPFWESLPGLLPIVCLKWALCPQWQGQPQSCYLGAFLVSLPPLMLSPLWGGNPSLSS